MRLIDADALMTRLRKSAKSNPGTIASALCELVCGDIELEPEAIVRCKDCKHYKGEATRCLIFNAPMREDGFCSYEERRTDE